MICTQVYQMVTALMTVAWWFDQFSYIVRRTPHPELGPTCEFCFATPLLHHADALHRHWLRRHAIFLLFLTLHKLFIMQHFFNYHYYYYLRFALFFVHRKMIRGLWRHSAGLHWPCYITTSACRALRSATSGPAWGMEPCPAASSDRVINTEHINQLSRFHAQSFNF